MKKITLSLVFLLTMVMGSYGQVSYQYGWEPAGEGGWTSEQFGFARLTTTPCADLASTRANTFANNNRTLISPVLGVSNGGLVTLTFDYKVMDWSANTVATTPNKVSIITEWSNALAGPWFTIETIGEANHIASTSCASMNYQFSPSPGNLFIRFRTISVNGADAYYYFDNINVSQGPAPTCVAPSSLTASAVATTSATLGWTAPTTAPSSGYEFYYSDVNTAPTVAGTAIAGVTANISGLTPNTNYYFWVRSKCGTDSSVWSGPILFRTLCVPFGDFYQSFDDSTVGTGLVPNCWAKNIVSTNTGANVSLISNTAASAPNAISMTNSGDATAGVHLITPALSAIGSNNYRMTFKSRGSSAGFPLIVGTMSNPTDASTFVPLQTFTLTNTYLTYNVTLNTSTTANFIAFKHGGGGTFRTIFIDDVTWEPIPTVIPACTGAVTVVINEGCGNFATSFSWTGVSGADGYKVSIGTSPNGQNLVVNNENINSVLTYSFAGNPNTQYYYTIKPYNALGDAVNCAEGTFTTFGDGCYCVAVPTSIDNSGISNVQVGDVNYAVPAVTYSNLTTANAADITRGVNTIMNVTLATSFSYWTNVWVDFNDNFTFEPSELLHVGIESSNANPTVVNTSFVTPVGAPLGLHRMRIVSTDNSQIPANPCYGGSYGVVIDLLVNVLPAPACLPPSASTTSNITASSATINWVSTGPQFNVELLFAGEPQGSGILTQGIVGNTTTLNGLDAQANYAYYLQTNCGSGSLSPWTGPFTFRTACAPFGDFTQNFTTETTVPAPECWSTLRVSTNTAATVQVSSFNDFVSFSNSGDATASLFLITPSLSALPLNTHRVKFRAYAGTAGLSLVVGTMSDPSNASTFTAVQTVPLTTTFADYAVSFINAGSASHVAFRFTGNATFQNAYLDDVIWEAAPTCPDIFIVNFIGATSSSADITWVPGGNETAWQYAYGASDLTDPSGLPTFGVQTTPAATISGLAPSTTYKVWVRAVCGTNFGAWSPARTFITACVPVNTFPWTEGFESTTGSAFPVCWTEQNGDWVTADQAGSSNYVTARTGARFLRNSWSAANEFMWTPGFELTAGVSYDFSFYMQADGFTGWTVDVFQNTVQSSTGATQLGGTTTASGTGAYVIQPYALISNTFVPTTSGIYYFAMRVNQPSGTPWYIAFDDFRMEPTPTCIAPSAPTAAGVTITSATLNWTATAPAPALGYDYFYTSDLALTPNAATVVSGSVGAGITTANIVGLSGSTIYRIFVRSICGANEKSSWSDAGTFTTNCINAALPYSINFENATVPNLPLCTTIQNAGNGNNWRTANNPGAGFTTKVLNYPYNGTNAANSWFYTNTMTLQAGTTYKVSYDYGNDFAFYTESLRVSYGNTANATAMTTEIANHSTINQAALQSNQATFTPTTTGDYVIGFQAYSIADQNQLYVDNILIEEVLSTGDFDANSFTAYPNPVKDVLNVSFTQNISDVTVYNLLGQQVLFTKMNTNKGQVDMSALASGTYLVKVKTETAVKTIKVMKQ